MRKQFIAPFAVMCALTVLPPVVLAEWQYQSGDTQDRHLSEVHFTDQLHGWSVGFTVGFGPVIMRTTDGGSSWIELGHGYNWGHAWAVHFADPWNGWVAGGDCDSPNYGWILHTSDGGQTWYPQVPYDLPAARFYGLYFVDSQHGWAVCANSDGAVYQTSDGGGSWTTNFHLTGGRFAQGLHFEDQWIGWVVGGNEWPSYTNGVIYRTTDGGSSWSKQWDYPGMCLYDVWFVNQLDGWVAGGGPNFSGGNYWGGVILHTDDGGQTWHEQYHDPWGPHLGSVCCVDAQRGWVTGAEYSGLGAAILSTTDGGQTWSMEPGAGSWPLEKPLNGVHFVDAAHGWAVGRDQRIVTYSAQPEYITVTAPATGTTWWVGDEEQIQWSSAGTSGQVRIEVSRDGGTTWSTLASSTPDDGDESWVVTSPPSTNCVIRVTDVDGTPAGTSGIFAVSEAQMTVTSPAAGDTWWVGDEEQIQWSSAGTSGQVQIEISRDGGTTWSTITSSTPDDGDESWVVTSPPSTNCVIRVTDVDGTPAGTSGIFAVSEAQMTVTSPAAGDTWWVGDEEQIQWSSAGTSGQVRIEVSRDGGATWSTLASSTPDDGDESWVVTGPPSSSCVIRVTDVDGTPAGTSGIFAVSEAQVTVTSPAAGEVWWVGDEEQIQWSSAGTSGQVRIEISRDAGATWSTITSSARDDGDTTWAVTGPPSAVCRLSVADVDGAPSGLSGIFAVSRAAAGDPGVPDAVALEIAGAHPCIDGVRLACRIPAAGDGAVVVYDVSGRLVRRLHDGPLPAGTSLFLWRPDQAASSGNAGLYLARLEALGQVLTKRFVLLR